MKIYAESITTENEYCTNQHIKDNKYRYGEGYKLKVPNGNYYVFATTQRMEDYKAYYSKFITCGVRVDCPSHDQIIVTVKSGEIIKGIDPQDWYKNP